MPKSFSARTPAAGSSARSGAKAGSRSPKHRGHRVDETPSKGRWSSDRRADVRGRTESTDGRPDWTPPENRPSRSRDGGAPARRFGAPRQDDRRGAPEGRSEGRSFGDSGPRREYRDAPRGDRRDDRAPRDDRQARTPGYGRDGYGRDDRQDRGPRVERDDRAPRYNRDDRQDRAPREDRAPRDDRASRYDRDSRAPRDDRRDAAPRSGRDDRAPRQERSDRAPRVERDERAPRFGRDDRASRTDRDDRAPRFNRDDRAPRTDRDDRAPRYDRDDRAPRYDRDDRAPRFDDRAPRSNRDDRAARYDRENSGRGAGRPDRSMSSVEDVVLERLEAVSTNAMDVEGVTFGDLGLGTNIVRTLEELGASAPFAIQAATIPDVLAGRDVLGRGRTGSGKTIAFGAPLVERILKTGNGGVKRAMGRSPRALILAPTRELALQIDGTIQPIARSVGLFTTQVYGGVPQARQVGALRRGVDIVIGTPGRIEDLLEQGHLDLSEIEIVVLDEADHMCDLGFLEPVQRILDSTRKGGQRLLFSATLDSGVATLVDRYLKDPAVHEVAGEDQQSSTIEHRVLLIDQKDKVRLVSELAAASDRTLVFARTRAFAEQLAEDLGDLGYPATSLHGDLNQVKRSRNLERLTSGRVKVLVATDVAARGIHVDDIGLVVQADAPEEYKTYLHRSGRTGRAGKRGTVVTLIAKSRRRKLEELLQRAEIVAEVTTIAPGGALPADLLHA